MDQPVDHRPVAPQRKMRLHGHQGNRPDVDIPRKCTVQPHLFRAGPGAGGQGPMVEIPEAHGLFQLEGESIGQEDKGHMRLDDLLNPRQGRQEGNLVTNRNRLRAGRCGCHHIHRSRRGLRMAQDT